MASIKYIASGFSALLCGMSITAASKGHYETGLTMLSIAVFFVLVRVIIADIKTAK